MSNLELSSIGDVVRDRVRKALMDSIPDEKIDQLIKNEFEKFFQKTPKQYGNGYEDAPFERLIASEVDKMLRQEMTEKLREAVKRWVQANWNGKEYETVSKVAEMVGKDFLSSFAQGIGQSIINNIANNGFR